MGALLLGPFLLKYEWIIAALALLVAYIVMKIKSKQNRSFQDFALHTIFNAVIIGFFTYKFSAVFFQPTIIFQEPLSVLYLSGGLKGTLLGLIFSTLFLIWSYRKGSWPFHSWLTIIVYGIVTFFISFWIMRTLFFLFN